MSRTARDSDTLPNRGGNARLADHGPDYGRDLAWAALVERLGPRLGPTARFATTEHFNLQTARSITVSESNGRATICLAAVSSNLIALPFIGHISRPGVAFYAFALILLPVLAFVGVVTLLRLIQSCFEELAYAHRLGLLRDFYIRLSPELERYLIVVWGTRPAARFDGERLGPSASQLTLTTAGRIAVVNSVVVAACAGLVLEAASVDRLRSPLWPERSSERVPSYCTNATPVARATPTGQKRSIRPRSSSRHRTRPTRPEGGFTMSPITRGFRGRRPQVDGTRIPPGQYVVDDFPVLSAGPTPHTPIDQWTFRIGGAVDQPSSWTWDELLALPAETPVVDIHCVTRWSKLNTLWKGVSLDTLLAGVETEAKYVSAWCDGGYTTNLPIEDVTDGRAWIAYEFGGEPLAPEHGGPARLLVPHLYFWKSAKWVRGLELLDGDQPGFWEGYGYHNYGDPWKEQRYAGD